MDYVLGSPEHKQAFCEDLIRTYNENIWQDELHIIKLQEEIAQRRLDLAGVEAKLEAKEFKSKRDGELAKELIENEIARLEQDAERLKEKVEVTWPKSIERVKKYMK